MGVAAPEEEPEGAVGVATVGPAALIAASFSTGSTFK